MMHDDQEGRSEREKNSDVGDENRKAQEAKEHFKQGVGLLFRAAFEAASGFKKELDRTGWTNSVENAGKELARAADHVKQRIEEEVFSMGKQGGDSNQKKRVDPQDPEPWAEHGKDAKKDAQAKKPKGPTDSDPGFWMAGETEEPKKK